MATANYGWLKEYDGSTFFPGTKPAGNSEKPVYIGTNGLPAGIDHTIKSDVPENAEFTDTKVTQKAAITTNGEYPVILANSTATTEETNTVNKTNTLKYNPSTKTLTTDTIDINSLKLNQNVYHFTDASGNIIATIKNDGITATNFNGKVNGYTIAKDLPSTAKLTETTYSAGDGISLSGTTFSHKDTSSATNLTANGRKYVTGLTFDTYGHVTGYTTGTETVTNTDTGATSVEVIGDGNAVTTASYNSSNRKLTLTKAANFQSAGNYLTKDEASNTYLPIAGGTITGTTDSSSTATGALIVKGGVGIAKNLYATAVYGAVWNDYAEYRQPKDIQEIPYGRVIIENGDDSLSLSTDRLQPGGNICSDTFGFAIGETKQATMPIAVSGRVLAYPAEDRNSYCAGDAVCTGPNGTVSKMTREEIREWPDRIIGYVSAIPDYETWGQNNVSVDGRIWIKVI